MWDMNKPKSGPEWTPSSVETPESVLNDSIVAREELKSRLSPKVAITAAAILAMNSHSWGTLVANAQDNLYSAPRIEDWPVPWTYQVIGWDSQKSQEQASTISKITTNEEFLQVAGMTDPERKVIFESLLPEQKNLVITYFNECIEENPKMTEKGKRVFGKNLVFYYDTINDMKKVVDEFIKTKKLKKGKVKVYDSAESNGEDIEEYFTKYWKKFSENWKIADTIFSKVMDENIARLDKETGDLNALIKILEELNKKLS